ncbi:MAG: hypothetical protein RLZZ385_2710 [Pseudomonadota bacterium]|jgi:tRNA (mo5U34)-methyltransferase
MNPESLIPRVTGTPLAPLAKLATREFMAGLRHGDLPRWQDTLAALPDLTPSTVNLRDQVCIGSAADCPALEREQLHHALCSLIPWRKGPFSLFGIAIDSEWRCNLKWDRVVPHVSPLEDRRILDVGSGNGYYGLRMAGAGADLVVGLEPHLIYAVQFWALRRYLPDLPCWVLPAALEQLPVNLRGFDTVFSMGVLYHVRSPIDHLLALKGALRKGGELVLETLVVDGPDGYSLMPRERYARMPNVWFVPSVATVQTWLSRCGFDHIKLVDISVTTSAEQRATQWMPFASLTHGLDPDNPGLTAEGLPAPQRGIFICRSQA